MRMKKSVLFIAAILFAGITALAQPQKVIEKQFEKFHTVKVEDKFILKLFHSDRFSVRITTDERIAAHVQAYEKNGTLYLILDEKGYSSDLKKQLRQKGAAEPVLEAEVYMPSFNSLVLSDKVILTRCDDFTTDNFTLTASGNAKVQQLSLACETCEIDASKGAQVTAKVDVASKLYLTTSNTANVSLTQNGGNAFLELGGSSLVDMKATVKDIEIDAESGAESHVSGTASLVTINAANLTRTDVELLEANEGVVTQTGSSKCHVNVVDKLKVNLTGGSMLTFKRTPSIIVERIVNSTLITADDPKRK